MNHGHHKNTYIRIGVLIALVVIISSIFFYIGLKYESHKNINTEPISKSLQTASIISPLPFIHPFCLGTNSDFIPADADGNTLSKFSLTNCNQKSEQYPYSVNNDGSFYADYPVDQNSFSTGFIDYKIIGTSTNTIYVAIDENTGGSGVFSWISKVSLDGTTLMTDQIVTGGDRCNGGLGNASFKNNILNYSVALTPYDIVSLTSSTTLQAYSDLEASAASCFGTANYSHNLTSSKEVLTSVTLTTGATDDEDSDPEYVKNYPYQVCFNSVFDSYVKTNKTELSLKDLAQFNQQFERMCIK